MSLFDAHAHVRADGEAVDALLQSMAVNGVDRAVVVGGGLLKPEKLSKQIIEGGSLNVRFDNIALATLTEKLEGKLLPFYFANPFDGASEYAKEGRRFHGLKLAPAIHGVPFRAPSIHALVAAAKTLRHPVYLHCLAREGFTVKDLVTLAIAFPSVSFILGHAGIGNLDMYAVDLIVEQKNIYFETSGGFSAVILYAKKILGIDRILFGSEYPLQNPRVEIVKAETLGLNADEFRAFTFTNIERLLDAPSHAIN